MLALSGCVVTGPVVQQWDSLVRNETNKRVAGGVRGETSASSSSSSCAATPPGLQRLASSQSAYSDTNDSVSTLFGVGGDDDELDGFGDQSIFHHDNHWRLLVRLCKFQSNGQPQRRHNRHR